MEFGCLYPTVMFNNCLSLSHRLSIAVYPSLSLSLSLCVFPSTPSLSLPLSLSHSEMELSFDAIDQPPRGTYSRSID
jgi:hypothetical protein